MKRGTFTIHRVNYLLRLLFLTSTLLLSCSSTRVEMSQTNSESSNNTEAVKQKRVEKKVPESIVKPVWVSPNYRGLLLGKSTYADMKRLFGEPRWEGGNEETYFENDSEFEMLLQYSNQGIGKEAADIVIGRKSKIVKSISILPFPKLTRQEAINQYGSDYVEISAGESFCIDKSVRRGDSESPLSYPVLLVYPEKGMIISIRDDNSVMQIGYLYKCK
jgi:hypothetical protein